MREDLLRLSLSTDRPPCPVPGFEAEVISELETLVRGLPDGVAKLRVTRVPAHPEWPNPCFEVTPTNLRAARFSGAVIKTDLHLTLGTAAWREFYGFARGGTVKRGASWQDEFRWIWHAVIAGGFTEDIYRNAQKKVIGWKGILKVNGTEIVFRNGRGRRLLPFGRRPIKETIAYEPYTPASKLIDARGG
jgi:hypothetical protein